MVCWTQGRPVPLLSGEATLEPPAREKRRGDEGEEGAGCWECR